MERKRDEKFTPKYNKTISPTNSYGTLNCVAYGAEYREKLPLPQPAHCSLGWKQTHMAFVSLNRPAFASRHTSWRTLPTPFEEWSLGHRFVLGSVRDREDYGGRGGELKQTAILPLHLLSFFHFFLSEQQKPGLRYILKVQHNLLRHEPNRCRRIIKQVSFTSLAAKGKI